MQDSKVSGGLFLCLYLQDDNLLLIFMDEFPAAFLTEKLFIEIGCKGCFCEQFLTGFIEETVCVCEFGEKRDRTAAFDLFQQ